MPDIYSRYVDEHLEDIKRDIKRLVAIKSVKGTPASGAPYGKGVREAQLEAMQFCKELGFETFDCDGRIAYAHIGPEDKFIGIIAHLDVVPEGTGWFEDPFNCHEREGFLVGRGVIDDKGPFVTAAYAAKYLIDSKINLKYGIRLIMGLDEETGMTDIEYYNKNYPAPIFAFTPDSNFPVCHGEKGIYSADLVSKPIKDGVILKLNGGIASNVVADTCTALLKSECADKVATTAAERNDIEITNEHDGIKITAHGKTAHAAWPNGGVNANNVMAKFLLDCGVLTPQERDAIEYVAIGSGCTTGEQFSIACSDGIFTPCTIICGLLTLKDGCIRYNVNCRYPTAIEPQQVEKNIADCAAANDFHVENSENSAPFYIDPKMPAIKLMADIYNEVTGSNEKPQVISGGTYARHMKNTVSYGMEFPGQENTDPDWVGGCHMKNEGVSIERIRLACEIYIKTLLKLQQIEL